LKKKFDEKAFDCEMLQEKLNNLAEFTSKLDTGGGSVPAEYTKLYQDKIDLLVDENEGLQQKILKL
jgi:hypothetical protein